MILPLSSCTDSCEESIRAANLKKKKNGPLVGFAHHCRFYVLRDL